jgi:hypothetical protein
MICPDAIPAVERYLVSRFFFGPDLCEGLCWFLPQYDPPEGISPRMVPRGQQAKHEGLGFYSSIIK